MKKAFLIIFILSVIICLFLTPVSSVAALENQDEQEQGFELDNDYKVEISFGRFNLTYGNILLIFSFTFDKSFYNALNEQQKSELLNFLYIFLATNDFKPEVDHNGKVVGSIEYDSITDMYIDSKTDGYEKNNRSYEQKSSFFFTETTFKQITMFDGMNEVGKGMNLLKSRLNIFGIEDQEIFLSYHYGTPYESVSTDAEKSYLDVNANIYVHEFYMTVENSGREIVLLQTSPNTKNWYLLAILIGVPIIAATFIGFVTYRKKQNNRRA